VALLDRPLVDDPADAEALFKEARRRRRQRRLVIGSIALLVLAGVAVGLSLTMRGNGGGHGTAAPHGAVSGKPKGASIPPVAPAASAVSAQLPGGYWFSSLVTTHGHLFVAGYVATKANLGPKGFTRCALAPVNPKTLKIGTAMRGDCNNPALTGHKVSPVNSMSGYSAQISLAVAGPKSGTYKTGPPLMTYSFDSSSTPEFAYGGKWLWIYEVETTVGPRLLQVNAQNGQVVETIAAPQLFDPLMAANDDGVWLANSFRGSASPYLLYHGEPGATQLTGTITGAGLHAYWLTANAREVWLGAGATASSQTLWRFDGPDAAVGLERPVTGFEPFGAVVGDQGDGLWTVVTTAPVGPRTGAQPLDVIRINGNNGKQQVMTHAPALPILDEESGLAAGESTLFKGSFYVLEPPLQMQGTVSYSRIDRVSPKNEPARIGLKS
jgi:hypothetical protein